MTETVPGPTPLPFIGNMLELSSDGIKTSFERLSEKYGEIFQIDVNGTKYYPISSARLLREIMDESRFPKYADPGSQTDDAAAGLFAAATHNPDWHQGHRIIQPQLGPLAIDGMFEGIRDVATQMCLKWARQAARNEEVLLTDDFTRVTLDAVSLCMFNHRFNSFYTDSPQPYVEALVDSLEEVAKADTRHWLTSALLGNNRKNEKAEQVMHGVSRRIVEERRANPTDGPDLLNTFIHGKDPQTGQVMRDDLIINQVDTFLAAGHETTSALLSFAFAHMMRNPQTYLRARAEVDEVIGDGLFTTKLTKKLKYIDAVLRETLRLTPPIPGFSKQPNQDSQCPAVIGGGKYLIPKDAVIEVLLRKCHTDPEVFGDDAGDFKPERMMEDNPDYAEFRKVWKPFGNGMRSCVGQTFALLEATVITAMILRNFDLSFANPQYKLTIKETISTKPADLFAHVRLRKGVTVASLQARLEGSSDIDVSAEDDQKSSMATKVAQAGSAKLTVLYGSNYGTCQALAQKLAVRLLSIGLSASVRDMDSFLDDQFTDQVLIFITSTYEGQPPENSARFMAWLDTLNGKEAERSKYAVFGCGDKNWSSSLWRIPKRVDASMERLGAMKVCDSAFIDVSVASPLDDFERWVDAFLIPGLVRSMSVPAATASDNFEDVSSQVVISKEDRAKHLADGMKTGRVEKVKVLTAPGQPEKRHLEIEVQDTAGYEPGDYLSILPLNPPPLVRRIMAYFGLPWDASIMFKSKLVSSLPKDVPLSVADIFSGHLELSQPPTHSNLQTCLKYTQDEEAQIALQQMASDTRVFEKLITRSHMSLFDVLVQYNVELPLAIFISLLMPLKPRTYSISSSPLKRDNTCTITYGVVRGPATADRGQVFEGASSTFLADLQVGDQLQCAFRRTATANSACPFRLPTDSACVPLLMFAAGTGIAPFRAFIQHRAIVLQNSPNAKLAPAVLFAGCRDPAADRLYGHEFDEWQKLGAVEMRYAFSSAPDISLGCKYVGDRMQRDWKLVAQLLNDGAKVYTCGSRSFYNSLDEAAGQVFETMANVSGRSVEDIRAEYEEKLRDRAVEDIFD